MMRQTGRTPGYWKQLARTRRAARALAGSATLADIAFAHCYADQAQMSRDFQRWFGVTPDLASGAIPLRWRWLPRRFD
ncbi:MAG: helix-turn-helix domain-containing protein [Uliginosibacterium sp.]|nr:helix-turn-helix domain-containing protein [Uliginosibacterium sp.]